MKGQRVGYIRVSAFDQNIYRQLEGLTLDKTFTDKAGNVRQIGTGTIVRAARATTATSRPAGAVAAAGAEPRKKAAGQHEDGADRGDQASATERATVERHSGPA